MICKKCNHDNPAKNCFCSECGEPFFNTKVEPNASPVNGVNFEKEKENGQPYYRVESSIPDESKTYDRAASNSENGQPYYRTESQQPYPSQPPYYQPQPPYQYNAQQQGMSISKYTKVSALLLCVFLGTLGIHRFYVGKIGTGILYLLTGSLFGIGWLVDIILIACGNFTDSKGLSLK